MQKKQDLWFKGERTRIVFLFQNYYIYSFTYYYFYINILNPHFKLYQLTLFRSILLFVIFINSLFVIIISHLKL